MKLAAKARCPIHKGRTDCCGRSELPKRPDPRKKGIWTMVRSGLWRAPDGREKCSLGELRKRKNALLRQCEPCAACGALFGDYRDVELSHRIAKGLGGSKHDDRASNLTLLHRGANRAQGSMDLETYLAEKWRPEHCG